MSGRVEDIASRTEHEGLAQLVYGAADAIENRIYGLSSYTCPTGTLLG